MDTRHSQMINYVSICLLTLILLLISGCASIQSPQPQFIPPESEEQPTEQIIPTIPTQVPIISTQPIPLEIQSDCTDDLIFIEDITFPDYSTVKPGTSIDKQWLVKNNGTCNWDYRYSLRLISGESLGAEIRQSLFPAISGSQNIIQISFTMPPDSGTFESSWQAFNFNDQPFGDSISILVVVVP